MISEQERQMRIHYSRGFRFLLVLPLVFLFVLGVLFFTGTEIGHIFPRESPAESRYGAMILFASIPCVLCIYWILLPRSVVIHPDRIRIRIGLFNWDISYTKIDGFKPAWGIPPLWIHSFVTCFGKQVEICRTSGWNIRICPEKRDDFIAIAQAALLQWRNNFKKETIERTNA